MLPAPVREGTRILMVTLWYERKHPEDNQLANSSSNMFVYAYLCCGKAKWIATAKLTVRVAFHMHHCSPTLLLRNTAVRDPLSLQGGRCWNTANSWQIVTTAQLIACCPKVSAVSNVIPVLSELRVRRRYLQCIFEKRIMSIWSGDIKKLEHGYYHLNVTIPLEKRCWLLHTFHKFYLNKTCIPCTWI